ncbi:MAG: zinc ribbon domain-containing protein [Anaerolineales bacterium]
MSEPFKLYRLQQIDSQIDGMKARLEEIEAALAQDQIIREAHTAAEDFARAEQAVQRELRGAEEEVKAQQEKIDQNQASLYGGTVTNPKELQDLQMEAESLSRHLRTLENVQLEKMMQVESAQNASKLAQENLEAVRAQREVENRTLGSEQNQLTVELARLQEERTSAAHGIPEGDIKVYSSLRQSKGGQAVAKVQNKTCSACGAELSASLSQASRSPNQLARCDTCKRILYAG